MMTFAAALAAYTAIETETDNALRTGSALVNSSNLMDQQRGRAILASVSGLRARAREISDEMAAAASRDFAAR